MAARTTTQLAKLAAEFPPGDHRSRTQGQQELTYVPIDATIRRLNEVLGANWSISRASTEVIPKDGSTYFATCELFIDATIDGSTKTAYGFGAMVNKDPDMAGKTALAEAIKKAGHQLGIALYLWDADARMRIEKRKRLVGNAAAMKKETYRIAREGLGVDKPSLADVAVFFGVEPTEMNEPEVLEKILMKEGVL